MDYKIVTYIADQIMGYLKADRPRGEGTGYIKAGYPSQEEKPCDVRIWYTPDPQFFYVKWDPNPERKRESFSGDPNSFCFDDIVLEVEPERKQGHISVWVNDLERTWVRYFEKGRRLKRAKRKREQERRWLKLQNVVIVRNSLDIDRDELCLQIGCYLAKNGILNDAAGWELYRIFQKYVKNNFTVYWRKIENTGKYLTVFKNLCSNFMISFDVNCFKSYLGITLYGMYIPEKREAILRQADLKLSGDLPCKLELGSSFYDPIYLGKVQAKKEKGKYIDIPAILEQIKKLKEQKEIKQSMAETLASKRGIGKKSAMRTIQRWRKEGLSEEEMARRCLEARPRRRKELRTQEHGQE